LCWYLAVTIQIYCDVVRFRQERFERNEIPALNGGLLALGLTQLPAPVS